jgi:hypothetical protein|tara:strand:- start:2219 stop:4387 length:2169 start_codon:yes stop_codon:yes gene_type:complete
MALRKLVFRPGINRDQTNYSSEGGWYSGDKIRFRQGFPEKIGGWNPINFTPYVGTASSLISYGTDDDQEIIGVGTNDKMYVMTGTTLVDTTPIRETFTGSTTPSTDNMFTTISGSNVIRCTLISGANEGDYVTFSGAVAIGGVPAGDINKEFKITDVETTTFNFTVDTAATLSIAAGGGTSITAAFQTHIGFPTVTYGYGWGTDTWGRLTFGSGGAVPIAIPARTIYQDQFNNDIIFNIKNAGIYYWEYNLSLSNRGVLLSSLINARAVPTQTTKSMFAPSGHLLALGAQEYSRVLGSVVNVSNITAGGTTAGVTTSGAHGLVVGDWVSLEGQAPAVYQGEFQVRTAPTATTFTYTVPYTPSTSATTPGVMQKIDYSGGSFDGLLIRWANVNTDIGPQPEEWKPELTNSAGFLRVKQGSTIVTGFITRQEVLVWTETALTTLQFTGTTEVFSQNEISTSINIMGSKVAAEVNNIVYWMGNDKFFAYDGRVNTLPCTLKQYVFEDMNKTQGEDFRAGINSQYNEVIWFYVSAASTLIDRYVIYNFEEKIWYYGNLNRTMWVDSGTIPFPLATSEGYVYRHEDGNNDGQPAGAAPLAIDSFIQSADMGVDDGDFFVLTKRVIPDVNFTNSETADPVSGAALTPEVQVTVGVRNFPGANSSNTDVAGNTLTREVVTTATIDQYTNQVFVRARGRQMTFRIASEDVGVQWQLGMTRVDFKPDGRRG